MPMHWEFDAIGTSWQVIGNTVGDGEPLRSRVITRIDEFDKVYSRFRTDSLVWKMSQKPGSYRLPPDASMLMSFYETLYEVSSGRVTPLIGKTMEQAGYDKDYSLVPKKLTPVPVWDKSLSYKQPILNIMQKGVLLDFGAAGKGYLVDIVASMLRDGGVEDFVINAGGDIWVEKGPVSVALEDPHDTERALGQVDIAAQAICASSSSRRNWGVYHHIIDPTTLKSEPTVAATWVIARSCMLADGLATALSFVKPDILLEHFDFEYAMIESGNIRKSPNFKATLFMNE